MNVYYVRKAFVLLLSIFIICFTLGSSYAFAEKDGNPVKGHWAEATIQDWLAKGYIHGYADGSFRPDKPITRAELIALINTSFNLTETAEAAFTDVKASDWYYSDLAKAKAAGYISGYSDGTFRANQEINRQELAVIIGSLLKLKPSESANDYTDTQNSPVWSKGAIGAVIDKAIMVGYANKLFQPSSKASRAEALIILDRSLKLKQSGETLEGKPEKETLPAEAHKKFSASSAVAISDTSLRVTFNQALSKDIPLEAVEKYAIVEQGGERKALTVLKVELLDDHISVKLTTSPQKAVVYELTTLFTDNGDTPETIRFHGIIDNGPKLIGATANDNIQLNLGFDRAIDTTLAQQIGNYTINGIDPLQILSATLLADHTTVILKTSAQIVGRLYTVNVSGIKDVSGNLVQSAASSLTFAGTALNIPLVKSAYTQTDTSVIVSFNVPLEQISAETVRNYLIDSVTISKAVLQADKQSVKLTTTSLLPSKKYKLSIGMVKGINGVTLAADTSIEFAGAPIGTISGTFLSALSASKTKLVLQFDLALDKTIAANIVNYVITKGSNSIVITKAELQAGGKKLILTTEPQISGALYSIKLFNLRDAAGNMILFGSNEFMFAGADNDEPLGSEFFTASASTNTIIKIQFNQSMNRASAEALANYSISGGLTISQIIFDANDKSAKLTVKPMTAGQLYTVTASNLLNSTSELLSGSASFAGIGQAGGPKITSVQADSNTSVLVYFDQSLDTASASTNSNYTINGLQISAAQLLADKKSVKLTVSPQTGARLYTLSISNLLNNIGIPIDYAFRTANFGGMAPAAIPVTLNLTAQTLTNTTIKLYYDQPLNHGSAETTANYTINTGLTVVQVSQNTAEQSLLLTVSPMNAGTLYNVTASILSASTSDFLYGTVSFAGMGQAQGPRITSVIADSNTSVIINFNQALDSASSTTVSNYSINGPTSVIGAALLSSGNAVKLTVSSLSSGQLYSLNVSNVRGTNGLILDTNYSTGNFVGISSVSSPNALKLIVVMALTNTSLKLVFSNELNEASASSISNYSISGGAITVTQVSVQAGSKEVILTVGPLTAGAFYSLATMNLQDSTHTSIDPLYSSMNFVGIN